MPCTTQARSGERTASESQVHLLKEIDSEVCDSTDSLSLGRLLEWMDACSCLAAEKHCGRSAVTLVMDEVDFSRDCRDLLAKGRHCILEGKVTKAFGSSLEVSVYVCVPDVGSGALKFVCTAFFMYVVLKTDAEKESKSPVCVPKLIATTAEEQLQCGLAELRRDFRKKRESFVEELCQASELADKRFERYPAALQGCGSLIFTELVLPLHANHMGNTFGGQIMSWMVKGAKAAIMLYLRRQLSASQEHPELHGEKPLFALHDFHNLWFRPVGVDSIHFKAPSHVGDRVTVTAGVTRIFGNTCEVKVCVTSAAVNEQQNPREINEGYFCFTLQTGSEDSPAQIPDVMPSTVEQDVDYRRAGARQQLRERRRQEGGRNKATIAFDPSDGTAQELIVQCLSNVLSLQIGAGCNWQRMPPTKDDIAVWFDVGQHPGAISRIKVRFDVQASHLACFDLLRDASRRKDWDTFCVSVGTPQPCGECADLVPIEYKTPGGDTQKVDLLRAYFTHAKHQTCIVVSRSVNANPQSTNTANIEILPSGFIVDECLDIPGTSTVTFLGQFNTAFFRIAQPHAFEVVGKFREVIEREYKSQK